MFNAEYELELAYWDKELSLLGDYPEDMKDRTIPERMKNIFPSCLFSLMEEVKGRLPKILDVGSGPVSMLNYAVVNNLAEIIAADPLSEGYYKLLFTYGYSIKYPMVACPGEELSKELQENFFDITWCHNALDHSKFPSVVIKEMVKVTKYGGFIVICTWENEGTYEGFHGLHKHNLFFNEEGLCLQSLAGDFGMLSPVINITKPLPVIIHKVTITERQKGRRWVELILKKQCSRFHDKRTEDNKNFFDALVNAWLPVYGNPQFPLWGSYALTTNDRGKHVLDIIKQYTEIKGKDFLDIGTAYGGFPVAFIGAGANSVTGFDINKEFLKLARENIKDNGFSVNVFYEVDVTKREQIEPFLNSFNIITCNDVIEHVENVKQTIKNISDLLKPDGIAYFEIPNKYYPGFIIKDGHYGLFGITLLPRKDAEKYYKEYFPNSTYTVGEYYDLQEYIDLFQDAGFRIEYVNTDDFTYKEQAEIDLQFLKDNRKELLSLTSDDFRGKLRYRLINYLKEVDTKDYLPFWKIIVRKIK